MSTKWKPVFSEADVEIVHKKTVVNTPEIGTRVRVTIPGKGGVSVSVINGRVERSLSPEKYLLVGYGNNGNLFVFFKEDGEIDNGYTVEVLD